MSSTSKKVALFGELLARLTPSDQLRFTQADRFDVAYTGGEANAGVVLTACGAQACLISAVPENDVGQACVNHMRRYGLDTQRILRRGNRLGLLYVEPGVAQRAGQVIYDRRGSGFAELCVGDIDWGEALAGLDWLHFTGTAPALSSDLAALTLEGCRAAHAKGLTVSCDLNYRAALWSPRQAAAVMPNIVREVDLLIANEEHAALILGTPPLDAESGDPFAAARYAPLIDALRKQYDLQWVALTLRRSEAADTTRFAALLDDGQRCCRSRVYDIRVVDRIGAGDAFSGGLVSGLLQRWEPQRCVDFASAAGCLKHTIRGDFCHASEEEISRLVETGSGGRLRR